MSEREIMLRVLGQVEEVLRVLYPPLLAHAEPDFAVLAWDTRNLVQHLLREFEGPSNPEGEAVGD